MLSARPQLCYKSLQSILCRNLVGGGRHRKDIPSVQHVTAKRYAHQEGGFALNAGSRSRNQETEPSPIVHQSIKIESQIILTFLQQQHADFLSRHSLSHLQIHRDGTFALSSRNRGWKIWSHQDVHKKKQQWLLVHTAGIFSQYLIPDKSDQQKARIENKVDMFVRRLERFGK
uniref:Uncharacterized protein n=1 Tax=Minutocellus polymorphus TaxID=265543 RepID=A0A7S0ATA5_9STRA|mmetsp:Transcript_3813/g.6606  ORF Transcript_3813/g.6606 Transcript_3813/m.6606 type:complete len:173 (+) Transcript_3813:53-571(+)